MDDTNHPRGPSFGPEPTTLMVWDITARDLLMETSWEGFSFIVGLTNTAVAWTELVEVTEQGQTVPTLMVNYADLADNRKWSSPLGEQDALVQFVFNPDEALLVASGFSGRIYIWDVETGEQVATIDAHVDRVSWLAFSADGTRLYSFGREGVFKVWGVE